MMIPPLRERKADIPALLQHFIREKVQDLKLPSVPKLAPGVIDRFLNYAWPGNVRELANVVEREIILHPRGPLTFSHATSADLLLPLQPQNNFSESAPQAQPQSHIRDRLPDETDELDEVVKQHIQHVLQKTQGKIHGPGGAAELLGINANTLRNRMNKLGIRYGRNRTVT